MLDKKKHNKPDIEGEMDELQRVSQDLSRDEDINISVEELVEAFENSSEKTLTDDIWVKLENTESNEIEKGDWDKVIGISKKYKKTNPQKLKKAIENDEYKRPLILKLGDRFILIAGNTRLSTAAAMGINPKVFIGEINVKNDINEKWSVKYKRSIDCNNPKGFSQRAHCAGRKKSKNENKDVMENTNELPIINAPEHIMNKLQKKSNVTETDVLKGGLSDNMTLNDIAKKHKVKLDDLKNELDKGVKVEMEHVNDSKQAKEIAMDHLFEDPKYYTKLSKIEAKESMGADSAGAYVGPMSVTLKKADIDKINNWGELKEALDASASGEFDVPLFGGTKGRKNPLSIGGPKSVKKRINKIKGPKFPKWGGPKSVFVQVKEKCKKFPYCNQGDINALEISEIKGLKEAIENTAKKYGISYKEVEEMVLNEIKQIFI